MGQAQEPEPVENLVYSIPHFLLGLLANGFSAVIQSDCSIANLVTLLAVACSLAPFDGLFISLRSSDLGANCHSIISAASLSPTIDRSRLAIIQMCFDGVLDVCQHAQCKLQVGIVIQLKLQFRLTDPAVMLVLHCYLWRVTQSFH